MPDMSRDAMDALTGQYARTIVDLSARLANQAVNLVLLGEQNAALTQKVAELEKTPAGPPT